MTPPAEDPPTPAPEPAPAPAPELTIEDARRALAYVTEHPDDADALPLLNELQAFLHRPELAADVVTAAHAVTRPVLAAQPPPPAAQAHMTILLANLLALSGKQRDAVDSLFVEWLRHPASYGPRPTPPEFQKPEFVQRLGDLLGWGALKVGPDREALERFAAWVNAWSPKSKARVRRPYQALQRVFAADFWRRVRF